jgi:tetratricopeptide (TPR) repeat protein
MWHVARGFAWSATDRPGKATAELKRAGKLVRSLPTDAREGFNPVAGLFTIASEMLAGDLAARRGDYDRAFFHLAAAIVAEDDLAYNEPSDWYLPARHLLGKILLDAGRNEEAQAIYESDLDRHPENGWALVGLAESLRRQDKREEAARVEVRLARAWQNADSDLTSSWQ